MSLVFTNKQDKNRSVDVIDLLLKHFAYPSVGPEGRANLTEHMEWLRRQPEEMKVDLKFQTFPETKSTVISLMVRFDDIEITTH